MKKYLSFFAAAILALGFTACEDVPAPYGINDKPDEGEVGDVILNESFSTSLGRFTTSTPEGAFPWSVSYSCAQVTSFTDTDGDGNKENNPAESWLISPKMDLTNIEAAHVTFDYILRYGNANELKSHYRLLVSKDYTTDVTAATWTEMEYNQVQGSDWDTWYNSGEVNIPAEFCKTGGVTVALCYKTTTKAATWEVKNFKVLNGAGTYNPDKDDEESVKTLPFSASFSSDLGGFKSHTTSGSGQWSNDYQTAKATGYDNATKVTTAGTYYLVSPEISLAGQTEVHLSYEYIIQYNKDKDNQQVLINANFDEAHPGDGWTLLNSDHVTDLKTADGKTDWNTFTTADLAIPAEYMGKNIRIAFRYNTNAESGSTWEVRNFSIEAGKPGENTGGSDDNTGDETAANGDFENWKGSTPYHWQSTTSASKGAITRTTDAHSGQYAAEVAGSTSGNNRLAYKELTLPAGTYTMKFYVKAATNRGGSVRPGYVPVVNGAAVNTQYTYGDYVNDLTGEWVLVEHTFTLDAETMVNPIVMISKNPGGAVIFDDFTLTAADGTIYIQ